MSTAGEESEGLEITDDVSRGQDVGVLRVELEQPDLVAHVSTVVDRVGSDDRAVGERGCIDRGGSENSGKDVSQSAGHFSASHDYRDSDNDVKVTVCNVHLVGPNLHPIRGVHGLSARWVEFPTMPRAAHAQA